MRPELASLDVTASLLEQKETLRRSLNEKFEETQDPMRRKKLGQFSTPFPLAVDILRLASEIHPKSDPIDFFDPALGTGVFYSALRQTIPGHLIRSAVGMEPYARLARIAKQLWEPLGLKVARSDFVIAEPEFTANLLIANPPYVRHHSIPSGKKARLQKLLRKLGLETTGLAGLDAYFLLLAHRWLRDNGLAIWLVSSQLIDTSYGRGIRKYLTETVTVKRIHRFNPVELQFNRSLVSSMVIAYHKTPPRPSDNVVITAGGSIRVPQLSYELKIENLRSLTKWTIPYVQGSTSATETPATEQKVSIGAIFRIRRGIATGANGFFVVSSSFAHSNHIPTKYLRPILPSSRHFSGNIIETEPDGTPHLENSLVLIDCRLSEEMVRKKHPRFWNYLLNGKKKGIDKRYLPSARKPWYSQEHRQPAPFLAPCILRISSARGRLFIWNKSQALATNSYLLLYPTERFERILKTDSSACEDLLRELEEIPISSLVKEARVYGRGLLKLEPSELERVQIRMPESLSGSLHENPDAYPVSTGYV